MLELMIQDAGFPDWTIGEAEMSMIGPQITQAIPFPGKRGARRAAAAAETRVLETEADGLRRGVVLDVRRAYARLYALDRGIEVVTASRDLAELIAATVSHHVETADMAQGDALRARLLLSRIEELRTDLARERAGEVAALNRILDRPGDSDPGSVVSLPRPEPPRADADGGLVERTADVAWRRASLAAAERRCELAGTDLRPDLVAGAGVGFRGGFDPVASGRLGVELPLWQAGKQRAALRAASAERKAATETLREARAAVRAEAARLRAAWAFADDQVVRYEQSLVPQSSLAFDAARSAYLAGRGDFGAVLAGFDLWLESRMGLARREAERFTAWAELDALFGPYPEAAAPVGDAP
jgi:outer membrane protein TolC